MDRLIDSLNQLYDSNLPCKNRYFVRSGFAEEVEMLCNELLISNNGAVSTTNIKILSEHGYRVWAGEKDSFGWLSGCIQKHGDERILAFG